MKIKFLEKIKAYFNKEKSQSELTVNQDNLQNKSYFLGGASDGRVPDMDTIKPGSSPDIDEGQNWNLMDHSSSVKITIPINDVEKISEKLVEVNQPKDDVKSESKPKPKRKYRPKKSKSSTDASVSKPNTNPNPNPTKPKAKKNGE